MEAVSKGLMPRLTPMLRIAFGLAAIFPLVPLVLVLGSYDLVPGVKVVGIPPSGGVVVVGLVAALFFAAFIGIAITGWNPLHRFDVAAAELRAEADVAAKSAPGPGLGRRVLFAAALGAVALLINWAMSAGISGITSLLR